MSKQNLPVFLGNQLRKYRRMQNITQEKFAEMLGTTAQTISNYERSGIKDVEVEEEISKALGRSLREDLADKEGEVGEVGKEILYVLLENRGCMWVRALASNHMHGMSSERVDHEIEKLEELDMCRRERYKDATGVDRDDLHITAKGIITYKNLVKDKYHEEKLQEILPNVTSFEDRLIPDYKVEDDLGIARDLEDYVQMRPWISKILDIEFKTPYMADYIAYLYYNHAFARPNVLGCFFKEDISTFFPGVNIYHDIIYRMSYKFTDKWREEKFFKTKTPEFLDKSNELYNIVEGNSDDEDSVIYFAIRKFKEEYSWVKDAGKRGNMIPFNSIQDKSEQQKIKAEYESILDLESDLTSFVCDDLTRKEIYEENAPKGMEDVYPDKWFSKDEIENFIKENFRKPQNEYEKMIFEKIKTVEKLRPRVKEYYSFPKEWEDNGLADLVRELSGIK